MPHTGTTGHQLISLSDRGKYTESATPSTAPDNAERNGSSQVETVAGIGRDGAGGGTGDRGLGATNEGIHTMVANLVKEALTEIGSEKTEAKAKKAKRP